jgi:hypothetical protein
MTGANAPGAGDRLDRARLVELVAESQRRLAALAEVQRELAELRVETRSRDRSLSVGLGPGGVLTKLTFHSEEYREMAPAELSELILETIGRARQDFAARTERAMAPVRAGARLPIGQIMSGTVDPAALLGGGR